MVYNYTIPRAPVAAMYSGPGPCYQVPGLVGYSNHDGRSTHVRAPQYSFGVRHGCFTEACGPGPCYYPDSKILHTGKYNPPHFSLASRHREAEKAFSPGPGAYKPELGDQTVYQRHPAYSLGLRHRQDRADDYPGPNQYKVDPMLGKTVRSQKPSAPGYSIASRPTEHRIHETPGAGAYKIPKLNVYKEASPNYSIVARNQAPQDSTQKPGPGAYSTENVRFL
ncbi:unnamed protein product [Dicrocoelium dendriticum]|nr:unnamed protein product [Dicrocoelium dendriticum]